MNKKHVLVMLLIAALVAAGCAAQRASEYAGDRSWSEPALIEAPVAYDSQDQTYKANSGADYYEDATQPQSLVIRNANLTIVVKDPSKSADMMQSLAEEMGGFVVSSNINQISYGVSEAKVTRASLTIRVPAERLNEALARIEQEAMEVTSKQVTGEDVTKQYTDLASRLRNLEAAEQQLREIMDSATETEDVLRIFEELRRIREQIEVIKGEMQFYQDSARLSSIKIELVPDVLSQPLQVGGWRPEGTAKEALEALIQALQFIGVATIWFGICILPILVLFGVPGYFVGRTIVRHQRKKRAEKSEPTAEQA